MASAQSISNSFPLSRAWLGLEGDDPEREDQAELTVEQGGAVFVDNKDLYRHTFVIEAIGVEGEAKPA